MLSRHVPFVEPVTMGMPWYAHAYQWGSTQMVETIQMCESTCRVAKAWRGGRVRPIP